MQQCAQFLVVKHGVCVLNVFVAHQRLGGIVRSGWNNVGNIPRVGGRVLVTDSEHAISQSAKPSKLFWLLRVAYEEHFAVPSIYRSSHGMEEAA